MFVFPSIYTIFALFTLSTVGYTALCAPSDGGMPILKRGTAFALLTFVSKAKELGFRS